MKINTFYQKKTSFCDGLVINKFKYFSKSMRIFIVSKAMEIKFSQNLAEFTFQNLGKNMTVFEFSLNVSLNSVRKNIMF